MESGTNLRNWAHTMSNAVTIKSTMNVCVCFSLFRSPFISYLFHFIVLRSCCVGSKWTCKVFQNALKHLEYEMLNDEDSAEWFNENRFLDLVSIQLPFFFLTSFLISYVVVYHFYSWLLAVGCFGSFGIGERCKAVYAKICSLTLFKLSECNLVIFFFFFF